MELVRDFWPQLVAFVAIVIAFATMKVDVDVLKEKVKTLFELWNKDRR